MNALHYFGAGSPEPGPVIVPRAVLERRDLRPGEKLLLALLLQRLGHDAGAVSVKELERASGSTYDQIIAWTRSLATALACPLCGWAHPLLEVQDARPRRYRVLRCSGIAEAERAPIVTRRRVVNSLAEDFVG